MKSKVKIITEITVVFFLILALTSMPLLFKMLFDNQAVTAVGVMVGYTLMAIVVLAACKIRKSSCTDFLGIEKTTVSKQLLFSLVPFLITLTVVILIPLALGVDKTYVLSVKYTDITVLILRIAAALFFVGTVEEYIFRGYLLSRIKDDLGLNDFTACLISSLMFGFWHFPSSLSLVNVLCTSMIGLFYSLLFVKCKNCTVLSLGIAHGLYDSAIILLSFFML